MTTYVADIFDGTQILPNHRLTLSGGAISAISPQPVPGEVALSGVLAPGFVDLQVNGGGGLMLGDDPTARGIKTLLSAHRSLGTAHATPTLITDRPSVTSSLLGAARTCTAPGFAGLHLEGPHLARAGAHDPSLLRDMTEADCNELCSAARALPALILTVAPERVSLVQIRTLAAAGATISLGHTNADAAACSAAFEAGATMATHLFNAMSPLTSREPGCVGASLASGAALGLIADGHHVDPLTIRLAVQAASGPVVLVSDAMAPSGTSDATFQLHGRTVHRSDGTLRLDDGTLAGADISLLDAVRTMIDQVGITPAKALAMATSVPAARIGLSAGHLRPGSLDILHISPDWRTCRWLT